MTTGTGLSSRSALVRSSGHLVYANRHSQQQHVVLTGSDCHAVRITKREPALRDGGHELSVGMDLVFVIRDVAPSLEDLTVPDLDRVMLTKEGEQGLFDRRKNLPGTLDGHRRSNCNELRLDLRELRAVGVLEHEGLANSQDLAVDPVHMLAAVVLDPEVVADGE